MILEFIFRKIQSRMQARKIRQYKRRVSFGDLITDRWENARQMGFGEGSTMYDNVLVLGDTSHVKVGRNTWIGPNVILDGSGFLTIGDNCSISASVEIYTHDTVQWATKNGTVAAEHSATKIGNRVYIGPKCVIARGVTIGDGAIIGAMSFVDRDIPAGAKAWGCPAKIVSEIPTLPKTDERLLCPVGYDP